MGKGRGERGEHGETHHGENRRRRRREDGGTRRCGCDFRVLGRMREWSGGGSRESGDGLVFFYRGRGTGRVLPRCDVGTASVVASACEVGTEGEDGADMRAQGVSGERRRGGHGGSGCSPGLGRPRKRKGRRGRKGRWANRPAGGNGPAGRMREREGGTKNWSRVISGWVTDREVLPGCA